MRELNRWLILVVVAVLAVCGCSVRESTRSGGLIAPAGTSGASTAPVVTVTVSSAVVETDQVRLDAVAGSPPTLLATAISGNVPTEPGADTTIVSEAAPAPTAVTTPAPPTAPPTTAVTTTTPTAPPPTVSVSTGVSSLQGAESPDAWALSVLDTAEPPASFGEGLLYVDSGGGETVWPVIVAATPESRSVGLMNVEDFEALGGYVAMVFVFDGDTTGAFWMRNTPLPLRITFVAADGEVVSGTDMFPCLAPTPAPDCERYFADGPYRIAVEHPLGPSFDLGVGSAASVTLVR